MPIEGPGASVAELPVFDGGTYPASASAMEGTEALFVSRADLRAICLERPEVSLKMLQVVGKRLRRLVGIIEELSFTTVRHRLISWLLRQAKAEGQCDRTRRSILAEYQPSGTRRPDRHRSGIGIAQPRASPSTELYRDERPGDYDPRPGRTRSGLGFRRLSSPRVTLVTARWPSLALLSIQR